MTNFIIEISLKNEETCEGCPCLSRWEYASSREWFGCNYMKKSLSFRKRPINEWFRPDWCPLIKKNVHIVEPSPLSEEEKSEERHDFNYYGGLDK